MQISCFRADVWETVIELIPHLHSFSFGINLALVSLLFCKEPSSWLVGLGVPENSNGVGGALHKPRLLRNLSRQLKSAYHGG